jgi:hypothetical protein
LGLEVNRSQALKLLSECTGNDIWSIEYCRHSQIPNAWIQELKDAYESGFESLSETIFFRERIVNQFEGIRDVDLACKIAQLLGVSLSRILSMQNSKEGVVRAIREAIEED